MFIVLEDRKEGAFLFEKLKKRNEGNDGETLVSISLAFAFYTTTILTFDVLAVISRVSRIFRVVCILTPGSSTLSRYALLEDESSFKESRVVFIHAAVP